MLSESEFEKREQKPRPYDAWFRSVASVFCEQKPGEKKPRKMRGRLQMLRSTRD